VDARSVLDINITQGYAMYVAVRLASAEESTANWILGVEFCINVWCMLQIFWRRYKIQGGLTAEEMAKWKEETDAMVRSLVTTEIIEVLIPVAYSMCYVTAFYGPNARLIGQVKNTYWNNTEVMDIKNQLLVLYKMAGIDACGAIIIGILLKLTCKRNILNEYCSVMRKNWTTLSIFMGNFTFHVRNIILNTKFQYILDNTLKHLKIIPILTE
jgi:hypothetical protein